jgi:sulfite exporter TauE/SafE
MLALGTAAATFATFGVALFVVADVSRLRVLRWCAGMLVVIAIGIVVQLCLRRRDRRR